MAEEGEGGGGSGDVLFILIVLVVLAAAWYVSGGLERASLNTLFIQPPFPTSIDFGGESLLGTNDTYSAEEDVISGEVKKVETALAALGNSSQSSQRGKVLIISTTDASETDVNKEYVVLKASASNRGPIPLTGWRLESSLTAKSASIGSGVETLVLGKGGDGTITLNPGDTVIVSSGRSPVGTSFRVNACTGYLSQFQTFTPDLSLFCPFPKNETTFSSSQDLGEACYDALETIPRCRIELKLPADVSEDCRTFVAQNLTYNGCVANHREDRAFASTQWRVFLNQSSELWKERYEVIKLVDSSGNLVDSATY